MRACLPANPRHRQTVVVIGSGLAAYGACLALLANDDIHITVVDIGLDSRYTNQPNTTIPNAVEHNSSYYVYGINDLRWPVRVRSRRMCSSHAIGGFSRVYSGAILAPHDGDLLHWPLAGKPTTADYQAVLSNLRIWQVEDELSAAFPLGAEREFKPGPLHVYVGSPRIALNKDGNMNRPFDCSAEFKQWAASGRISYLPNRYVTHMETQGHAVIVHMRNGDRAEAFSFAKAYVGAGCINTTAMIDRSLFQEGRRCYRIQSAVLSLQLYWQVWKHPQSMLAGQSRQLHNPDLCKVFLEHRSQATQGSWCHTQINSLNKALNAAIKSRLPAIAHPLIDSLGKFFFFSISVFHSTLGCSSSMLSHIAIDDDGEHCQTVEIHEKATVCGDKLVASLQWAVLRKFTALGLLPLPFGQMLADIMRGNRLGGWHYGGTLPMMQSPTSATHCDARGELAGLKNVYIIDASAFPSIPASTVALLTMANAHRIARISTSTLGRHSHV